MGSIREAESRDLSAVKRMTDDYIGKDFYTLSYLEEILKNENRYLFVYADEQDAAVAYLYLLATTFRDATELLHIPGDLLDIAPDTRVGVYKTACTQKEWRGRGILTAFLAGLEKVLRQGRVQWILFTALQMPDGRIPVHKAVSAAGFSPVGTLSQPWIHTDAYCPYCKNRYCTCNAVVYTKEMRCFQ